MVTTAGPPRLSLDGLEYTFMVEGRGTGGRYALVDVSGRRGASVPLHVHANEDEWVLVLDGALDVDVDGAVTRAGVAHPVMLPRRVPHALSVASEAARYLVLWDPAGFEEVLRAVAGADPAAPPLPADDVAALLARAAVTLL